MIHEETVKTTVNDKPAPSIRERLIAIGGHEWIKDHKHRIYFNTPMTIRLFNVLFITRDMVTIESATQNGEPLSSTDAWHILDAFRYGKVWYDFIDDDFHYTGDRYVLGEVITKIKALVKEV